MTSFPTDLSLHPRSRVAARGGLGWRVGITQFAVDQLGDITLVDLPREGDLVTKGQRFGTIESVKSVSDLYAPVSGRVTAVNAALKDAPESVNSEPYGAGWMIELEPTDQSEIDELMAPRGIRKHVASSDARRSLAGVEQRQTRPPLSSPMSSEPSGIIASPTGRWGAASGSGRAAGVQSARVRAITVALLTLGSVRARLERKLLGSSMTVRALIDASAWLSPRLA